MSQPPDDIDWNLTTWEGVRREQLRRAAALTLRERMQSLEDMAVVAERFRQMREAAQSPAAGSAPGTVSGNEAHAARQAATQYDPNGE